MVKRKAGYNYNYCEDDDKCNFRREVEAKINYATETFSNMLGLSASDNIINIDVSNDAVVKFNILKKDGYIQYMYLPKKTYRHVMQCAELLR